MRRNIIKLLVLQYIYKYIMYNGYSFFLTERRRIVGGGGGSGEGGE